MWNFRNLIKATVLEVLFPVGSCNMAGNLSACWVDECCFMQDLFSDGPWNANILLIPTSNMLLWADNLVGIWFLAAFLCSWGNEPGRFQGKLVLKCATGMMVLYTWNVERLLNVQYAKSGPLLDATNLKKSVTNHKS